jgi:hypothetical protein
MYFHSLGTTTEWQVKRKNLAFAVAYLILVVLPLLGIVAVLRNGRTLVAPVSVGGLWRIQANSDNVVLPCGKPLAVADASFTISQSGKHFTLNFASSFMSSTSGAVEGNFISATILPLLFHDGSNGILTTTFMTSPVLEVICPPENAVGPHD